MIPGNAQPTIQYLMKVFLMSETCLLVSRTAQNKIYLKNLEYILKNCHHHHHNLSYSHCLLVNFGIFKLSLNFLFAFKGSKCLLWIKRRFESHNAQGNISRQYENFKIYEDLYGKSVKCDWMAKVFRLLQILLTFGGRYNRCFWDIRLKMYRLINFNMFSQLVLKKFTKAICFRFCQKLITCWSRDQLMQKKAYHYQNYHHYHHYHHQHHHLHYQHNVPPTPCRSACQIFSKVFRLGVWKKFWINLLQTVVLESRFIQIQITPLLSTLGCRNKMIQEQEVCLELLTPACLLCYINFKVSCKSNWKLL